MKYKLALIQADFSFGKLSDNLRKAEALIRDAARQGAVFICLPESFNQGYSGKYTDRLVQWAETPQGETLARMTALAKELHIYLIAPICVKHADGACKNSAFLISDEGIVLGSYDKSHLIPCEKNLFLAGNRYPVFDTKYGRIGILICNDLCFVEPARILGIQDADIIFVAAAWRFFEESAHWWEQMLRAHALNNLVMVAAVNRIGAADDLLFAGESLVIDPDGSVIKKLIFPEERILIQEVSLEEIRCKKNIHRELIRDRKAVDYKPLCVE